MCSSSDRGVQGSRNSEKMSLSNDGTVRWKKKKGKPQRTFIDMEKEDMKGDGVTEVV